METSDAPELHSLPLSCQPPTARVQTSAQVALREIRSFNRDRIAAASPSVPPSALLSGPDSECDSSRCLAWGGRKLSSLDQEYNNIDDGPGVPPMGRLFHYVHRSSIILSGGCLALIVLPWMSEVVASVTEQFLWVVPPSDFTELILGETPSNESSESLIWVIPPSDSFSAGWRDLTSGPCVCLQISGPEKHKMEVKKEMFRMGENVMKYSYGIQLLDFSCIYDALHCAQHQFGLSVCCLI